MLERAVLPDLRRPRRRPGGDRQPDAAHVGRERERAQRAARRRDRPARRRPAIRRWRSSPAAGRASRSGSRRARPTTRGRGRAARRRGRPRSAALLGRIVFGVDDDSMESVVLDLLRRRGLTLGLAESLTGGLGRGPADGDRRAPATCSAAPSCRYASEVKFDLLGVPPGRSSPRRRPGRWPRAPGGCSAPTSGWRSPAWPGRPSRTASPVGTVCIAVALPSAAPHATTLRLRHAARPDPPVRRDHRLDLLRRQLGAVVGHRRLRRPAPVAQSDRAAAF